MRNFQKWSIGTGLAASLVALPAALADIKADEVAGFTIGITETFTDQWTVVISGSAGSENLSVNIFSNEADTDSIISLTVSDSNNSGFRLGVSLGADGSPQVIVNISGAIGYDDKPFDLDFVRTSGDMTANIDVFEIGDFFIGGDINADILAEGNIGKIHANRHILGSISTIYAAGKIIYGRIEQITADGNIGSVSVPLAVDFGSLKTQTNKNTGNTGMDLLKAANIYVDLDGTHGDNDLQFEGNIGGPFGRLETTATAGVFEGTFHVNRISRPNDFEDIVVNGDIGADIIIDWLQLSQIWCKGDFKSTASITSTAAFYDRSGTGVTARGIIIDGDLAGDIWFKTVDDQQDEDGLDKFESEIIIKGDITSTGSITIDDRIFKEDDNGTTNVNGRIDVLGTAVGSNGDLAGSITVNGGAVNNGDLEGTINIAGDITSTGSIVIGGSVIGTSGNDSTEGFILVGGDLDSGGEITVKGDLSGLSANGESPTLDIAGGVSGFIDIRGGVLSNADLYFQSVEEIGEIWIGGGFDGFIAVAGLPASPPPKLAGQIIINADDSTFFWDTGVIEIGEGAGLVTLTAPNYPETPDEFGNGAVGEVGFMLHFEACIPLKNSTSSNLNEVLLRFYGPVRLDGAGDPILIEHLEEGTWVDRTATGDFTFEPFDTTNGWFNTTLKIQRTNLQDFPTGQYRISKTTYLKCDYGVSPFAAVEDFGLFHFTVE